MSGKTFVSNFSEIYFSVKEKKLKRAKVTSALILLFTLFLFSLNTYDVLQSYGIDPFYHEDIRPNLVRSLIYQVIIFFGLLIRFISLRFNNRYALRLSELGTFLAFSSWLGYLVWSTLLHNEISKIADVNYSSHLVSLDGTIAIFISLGFVIWFLYKIIFLTVVALKTIKNKSDV